MERKNNIIVNATAARTSGALTILKQFLSNIPLPSNDYYYIFIDSLSLFKNQKFPNNIIFIEKQTKSWSSRIYWDLFGLNNWIRNSKLDINLYISLQNTGSRINNSIPKIVYYHQPLAIYKKNWNFFKKDERKFFFYKNFYSIFVKLFDKFDTNIVVQVPFIKDLYIKKFNINPDRVYIIKPEINQINWDSVPKADLESGKVHFIYPATNLTYKNHILLLKVVKYLRDKYCISADKFCIHFTFKICESLELNKFIKKNKLDEFFAFHDKMPFELLLSYYKTAHCLLFPSYIETLGLPLLEAASIGLPIFVNDLPYSRDVIGDYNGVKLLKFNDVESWANEILAIIDLPTHFESYIPKNGDGWSYFFELVNKIKI